MIYILIVDVSQTGLYFVYINAHFVCLYCLPAFSLSALRLTKFYYILLLLLLL